MRAIDNRKYKVVPIGITKEGRWLVSGDPIKLLRDTSSSEAPSMTAVVADPTQRGLIALEASSQPIAQRFDLIIPMLHGTFGEDGTVQGLLEMAGVPYVGAGVLGSALGMDKVVMKVMFRARGLPVVDFVEIRGRDWERNPDLVLQRIEASIGYPCFVKPANLGSSVGISKVTRREDLGPALDLAGQYDRKLIVEDAAEDCREIECAVLGNDDPQASVPGEVVPKNEFYDYEAKYADDRTELIIPASLPTEVAEEVRRLAIEAFKAIDCAGMARVDFFVDRRNLRVLVNEINTIPGFTEVSMYPKLWEASGVGYTELIDRLIGLAMERHAERSRLRTTYDRP